MGIVCIKWGEVGGHLKAELWPIRDESWADIYRKDPFKSVPREQGELTGGVNV